MSMDRISHYGGGLEDVDPPCRLSDTPFEAPAGLSACNDSDLLDRLRSGQALPLKFHEVCS